MLNRNVQVNLLCTRQILDCNNFYYREQKYETPLKTGTPVLRIFSLHQFLKTKKTTRLCVLFERAANSI